MKKTKIIATLGPACSNKETLKQMILSGMDVARVNLSHGNRETRLQQIELIKDLRKELNVPVAIMLDTRGPDIRIKNFANNSVMIKKGQTFIFKNGSDCGNENYVCINHPEIFAILKPHQKVYANDGMLKFTIKKVYKNFIECVANNSGELSNNKSLCFPKTTLNIPYLNNDDKKDIIWGIEQNVDYIAASFVSSKDDINLIKKVLQKYNANTKIIAKIENSTGLKNLDEIIDSCDGIMVARGDLGIEMPLYKIPYWQKTIISKCNEKAKISITATEMLESMTNSIRPTRAETSDVANAVYDGSSAVMLSAESAVGKYPVEAIKTMAEICVETEKTIQKSFNNTNVQKNPTISEIIANACANIAQSSSVKAIVVFSTSGNTARLISKFKPACPVIVATPKEKTYNELALIYGSQPVLDNIYENTESMFNSSIMLAKDYLKLNNNDKIIVVSGEPNKVDGTNLIKVITI